jgi:hypothetical protein
MWSNVPPCAAHSISRSYQVEREDKSPSIERRNILKGVLPWQEKKSNTETFFATQAMKPKAQSF